MTTVHCVDFLSLKFRPYKGHKMINRNICVCVHKYYVMSVSLTLFLPPLGLSSSQVEVEMLHSAGVKGEALPVCRASRRADLPCRGGPITSIFNSLQRSAFRSCARRKARTDAAPVKPVSENMITSYKPSTLHFTFKCKA